MGKNEEQVRPNKKWKPELCILTALTLFGLGVGEGGEGEEEGEAEKTRADFNFQ